MNIDRWHQFSLAEQMGNICSEISRADFFEQQQDQLQRRRALERALELIDLTMTDVRYVSRLKELTQLRAIMVDALADTGVYTVTLGEVAAVLLPFGVMARQH